jgi:toxin FitB
MFLLDTNVVSELRRARRTDPNVAAWAESVPQEDMFLSSVTILELEMGALRLALRDGDRGRAIQR